MEQIEYLQSTSGWEGDMLLHLFESLQHNSWIVTISSSAWISAILELTHYFSFFLLVGSIAIVDLRLMGVAGRRQSATQLAEQVFPWMWTGLGLTVLSGFLMFAGDATEYLHNSVFHEKLYVILLAVAFGVMVQRNVPKWDKLSAIPAWAKFVAFVSLALWVGAILMGVNVPAITGVG
jgi:uncharacterized membrane protein